MYTRRRTYGDDVEEEAHAGLKNLLAGAFPPEAVEHRRFLPSSSPSLPGFTFPSPATTPSFPLLMVVRGKIPVKCLECIVACN